MKPTDEQKYKNGVSVSWEDVKIEITNMQPRRIGAMAEIGIRRKGILIDMGYLNVLDTNKIMTIERKLKMQDKEVPWARYVSYTCLVAKRHFDEQNPVQPLEELAQVKREFRWVCRPFLAHRLPTILFGPGGTGKSKFALWLACHIQNGMSVEPYVQVTNAKNVLYLDWESDPEECGSLADGIRNANPELVELPMYRRCEQPLSSEAYHLTKLIQKHNVDTVVIDSLALAAGGDSMKPEDAVNFFRIIRFLDCNALILAHPPKNPDATAPTQVFGSAFFQNLTRSVWEMRHAAGGEHIVGLFHRKCNYGKLRQPQGWKFSYSHQPWTIDLQPCDIWKTSLKDQMPLGDRAEHLLSDGAPRSAKEIAKVLMLAENKWKTVHKLLTDDDRFDQEPVGKPDEANWMLR